MVLTREHVLRAAEDAGVDFAVYDRKDDEDMSRRDLEDTLRSGVVTAAEIAAAFGRAVIAALGPPRGAA